MAPLTDPARGEGCTHAPCCNYPELRDYVARTKSCPVAGCSGGGIARTRSVVRDQPLRAAIAGAAAAADPNRGGAEFGWWCASSSTLELGETRPGAAEGRRPTASSPRKRAADTSRGVAMVDERRDERRRGSRGVRDESRPRARPPVASGRGGKSVAGGPARSSTRRGRLVLGGHFD